MNFDSQSLERLRKLSRQLPPPLPTPNKALSTNQESNSRLHRIETEEDPHELFKELIKASPDGKIPKHLIDRLKEVEDQSLEKQSKSKPELADPFDRNQKEQVDNLYVSFKRLLLEEEEED